MRAVAVISSVSVSEAHAVASHKEPVAKVSYLDISVFAEATFPDRLIVEVVTPADQVVKEFTKTRRDRINSLAERVRKGFSKAASEVVLTSDHLTAVRTFVRYFSESIDSSESHTYAFTKAPFNFTVAASDLDTYVLDKNTSDVVSIIDNMDGNIQFHDFKVVGDVISTPGDQQVTSVSMAKSESVSASSSGIAFTTDYADISYFAADYVGVSSNFS